MLGKYPSCLANLGLHSLNLKSLEEITYKDVDVPSFHVNKDFNIEFRW